jgi:hypothetical protein
MHVAKCAIGFPFNCLAPPWNVMDPTPSALEANLGLPIHECKPVIKRHSHHAHLKPKNITQLPARRTTAQARQGNKQRFCAGNVLAPMATPVTWPRHFHHAEPSF